MSNDKLKPCPLPECGSNNIERLGEAMARVIYCKDCDFSMSKVVTLSEMSKDTMGEIWNTRTPDTRIEEALKEVDRCIGILDRRTEGGRETVVISNVKSGFKNIISILERTQ